jgi:hypothetical protein
MTALITLPVPLGHGRHVVCNEALGGHRAGVAQRQRVHAPVAEGDLLGHSENPVCGHDQGGAVGRDETALDRASGLHQLGADHHVHVAGHRHQRQHGIGAAGRDCAPREQFDVVDRGARALRHARDGSHLRQVAVVLAHIDDPVRQDAAAFAPHGEDGDPDRAGRVWAGHRCLPQADAVAGFGRRRCTKPITAPRMRALK